MDTTKVKDIIGYNYSTDSIWIPVKIIMMDGKELFSTMSKSEFYNSVNNIKRRQKN
ncbi:Hypothetical protein ORPV_835 [Orpheovirus IHUMI-LCC2]|uniref:Uncharacterized protein n=1 Tax=Orpheovirus IHUMI-LCC2 TaxID=2023057 RepID=A0A2I2L5K6_9VIRU|nr:Hypothetical protein ORPV_835 [Orpheovirus IHUMI-LCC2]SNW62739.1 Hypothetical protein ORPV_835 [Orpheovirus IHUMI-LCC2]